MRRRKVLCIAALGLAALIVLVLAVELAVETDAEETPTASTISKDASANACVTPAAMPPPPGLEWMGEATWPGHVRVAQPWLECNATG